MKQFKFILSGGGTVGHINPALAIAKELRFRYPNCKILFVGAKGRMEMKIIPSEGFKIIGLWISGYVRKKIIQNILLPFKLIVSFFQSLFICVNFKPDLLLEQEDMLVFQFYLLPNIKVTYHSSRTNLILLSTDFYQKGKFNF